MSQQEFELTQAQIDRFRREQYMSIDRLTDDEDVSRIRDIYDRLIDSKAGWDSGDQYDLGGLDERDKEPELTQLVWPSKYAPELDDCRLLANATRMTKQLFGDESRCFIFHFIYKAPLTGAANSVASRCVLLANWMPTIRPSVSGSLCRMSERRMAACSSFLEVTSLAFCPIKASTMIREFTVTN